MQLSIAYINDVHGYLEPHPELFYKGGKEIIETAGGFAGYIYFDPAKTKVELIKEAQTKDKLTVFTSDTESKEIENPFHITPEGNIYKPADLNIDDEL